jgi:hypothetical protein
MQVQQHSGHVKMIKLELQNEKRKANQRDGRASKRHKLGPHTAMGFRLGLRLRGFLGVTCVTGVSFVT